MGNFNHQSWPVILQRLDASLTTKSQRDGRKQPSAERVCEPRPGYKPLSAYILMLPDSLSPFACFSDLCGEMMTTEAMFEVGANDAELVAESLAGDRDAFARIVA